MDTVDCPSCDREFERGQRVCPHCGYEADLTGADPDRAARHRQERVAREARDWADTLPPARPPSPVVAAPAPADSGAAERLFTFGWITIFVAAILGMYSLTMETTANTYDLPLPGASSSAIGQVANLSLLAARSIFAEWTIGLFICGIVQLCASAIVRQLSRIEAKLVDLLPAIDRRER